ncbi:hypothetical protein O181_071426 [Austropuccinia psidii MF-1]|uniref:Uncharacterized protein n=1 Tax=Austropuccinia psidii MF-1 TaxID=1389203 RepID=A0A9Q3F786_9BASI|nr:hypothetical protein [Austropuccinia psidii MF-1]
MPSIKTYPNSFVSYQGPSYFREAGPATSTQYSTQKALPPKPTLDMAFNRRSLDWTEIQDYSPHSLTPQCLTSCAILCDDPPQDIAQQLARWNFPSRPAAPPRLLIWGPYNQSNEPSSPPQPLRPAFQDNQTSTFKTHKRRRDYCLNEPPAQTTPYLFSKRPRTMEEDSPPKYSFRPNTFWPTPPFTDVCLQNNIQPPPITSSTNSIHSFTSDKATSQAHPIFLPYPQCVTKASYSAPLCFVSGFQTQPHPSPTYNHPQYFSSFKTSPIWSEEWHHTYNQFRNTALFPNSYLKPPLEPMFCS